MEDSPKFFEMPTPDQFAKAIGEKPIVLASGNPHKLEEMNLLFAGKLHFETLSAAAEQAGITAQEPPEVGISFEENASLKAMLYAKQLGRVCLADDSGLEVDALGGQPGVISSHYSTGGMETGLTRPERDAANNARLLKELHGVPLEERAARFVCVMAIARPQDPSPLLMVRGTFEGRIGLPEGEAEEKREGATVPRGANGFGYDPLFLVGPDFVRTGAELMPEEKSKLSHRASAAEKVKQLLAKR